MDQSGPSSPTLSTSAQNSLDVSPVGTPSIKETSEALRRTLSFKGLSQLDAKAVSESLWRKQNLPSRRPKDLDALIAHSIRGFSRGFILAYSFRASFNLLLLLVSLIRKRHKRLFRHLMQALFGQQPLRFGLMFGGFVGLYRWTFHGLRLFNNGADGKGREARWHAAAAGAVASFALLAENADSRTSVVQQVFIRSMQGFFHRFRRRGFAIPHGDILLFGISCGSIMYSWLMAPSILDSSYRHWISMASQQPYELPAIQRAAARGEAFPVAQAQRVVENYREIMTTHNLKSAMHAIEKGRKQAYDLPFSVCSLNHPRVDSCLVHAVTVVPAVSRFIMPVYLAIHLLPALVLRRKAVLSDPQRHLIRAVKGTLRSSLFLGMFVFIYQGLICCQRQLYFYCRLLGFPWLMKVVTHRANAFLFGFATCLSLFVEAKPRREELALYVLPRAIESSWAWLKGKGVVRPVANGELLLHLFGMSVLMDTWRHEREALSSLVRTILYQSVGP